MNQTSTDQILFCDREWHGLLFEFVTELCFLTHLEDQLLVLCLVHIIVEPSPDLLDDVQNLSVHFVI